MQLQKHRIDRRIITTTDILPINEAAVVSLSIKLLVSLILTSFLGNQHMSSQDNMIFPQQNRNGGSGNGGGGYNMQNQQMHPSSVWSNQNRNNLDMPNLQNLGINSQGQNPPNQGQNMNNALGSK